MKKPIKQPKPTRDLTSHDLTFVVGGQKKNFNPQPEPPG
jgi:hypothetical protein